MTPTEFTQRFIAYFAPYNEPPYQEVSGADTVQWVSELYEMAKEALSADEIQAAFAAVICPWCGLQPGLHCPDCDEEDEA